MSRDYLAEAVLQLRTEREFGPDVPDEMIANTFAAQLRALDLAAAELPRWTALRYRRKRARFDRRQRRRIEDFIGAIIRS